jgi:DNA-binding phage protein
MKQKAKQRIKRVRTNIAELAQTLMASGSLDDAAKKHGIPASTLRRAALQHGTPSLETLVLLLEATDADPKEVLACK